MSSTLLAGAIYQAAFRSESLAAGRLTISLLSMFTLRRLTATALMSFSFIHDLKSLTAKAAETPVKQKPYITEIQNKGNPVSTRHIDCHPLTQVTAVLRSGPGSLQYFCLRTLLLACWTPLTAQHRESFSALSSTLTSAI